MRIVFNELWDLSMFTKCRSIRLTSIDASDAHIVYPVDK